MNTSHSLTERTPLVVYWSRRDFRLEDNRALRAASEESASRKSPLLPLFIIEDYMATNEPEAVFGEPQQQFLTEALPRFAAQFPYFIIARGKGAGSLKRLASHYALSVHVNEDIYPDFFAQIQKLRDAGISVKVYADMLTASKQTRSGNGTPYSVFTPFKKAVLKDFVSVTPAPKADLDDAIYPEHDVRAELELLLCAIPHATQGALATAFSGAGMIRVSSATIAIHELLPRNKQLERESPWYTDEQGALAHFDTFLRSGMDAYAARRNSLADDVRGESTSRMSLALAWGLVSARMLVSRIQAHYNESFDVVGLGQAFAGPESYISELVWREFYKYLLYLQPELLDVEFQEKFRNRIQWIPEAEALRHFHAWTRGETGYPLVDAAMHQLATQGWMHNRARMVVASVLSKNLGVDWRWGQEYFRATLYDLDEASNNGGWQWAASVGADPKPIRIFNPELQAKTHDAERAYQEHWLPDTYRSSPLDVIVPHAQARQEALERYGLSHTTPRDF
jgi:deoxyribodipyrimidine photo-lyase